MEAATRDTALQPACPMGRMPILAGPEHACNDAEALVDALSFAMRPSKAPGTVHVALMEGCTSRVSRRGTHCERRSSTTSRMRKRMRGCSMGALAHLSSVVK